MAAQQGMGGYSQAQQAAWMQQLQMQQQQAQQRQAAQQQPQAMAQQQPQATAQQQGWQQQQQAWQQQQMQQRQMMQQQMMQQQQAQQQQQQQQQPPQQQQQPQQPQQQQPQQQMQQQHAWQQQQMQQQQQQQQQQMQQQQSWASSTGAAGYANQQGAPPRPVPGSERFIVSTTGDDKEEVVIKTLVGEYLESSTNHGRKVFQKVGDESGADFVEVYLYYWDDRDGPQFSGWWFGNKLGGTQVWSRCPSDSMTPPGSGWCIPWDGNVRQTLQLAGKAAHQRQEVEVQLKPIQEQATEAAQKAKPVLEEVKAMVGDYSNLETLTKAHEMLAPHVSAMQAAARNLNELQQGASGGLLVACQTLGQKLRPVVALVNTENNKINVSKSRLESEAKKKEIEDKRKAHVEASRAAAEEQRRQREAAEAKRLEAEEKRRAEMEEEQRKKNEVREVEEREKMSVLLSEAEEKLKAVQETVGKAADAEGPFLMGVEELPLDDTLTAVKACESASTAANTSTSIARMYLATKLVEVKRFLPGPGGEAAGKLKALQAQLEVQTAKLATIKKNTQERKSKALMREAEARTKHAEAMAKKVSECAALLVDDSKLLQMDSAALTEAAKETQKAEVEASAALAEARKFITARQIESKGKDATSFISGELMKCQARVTTATAEVSKFKNVSSTVDARLAAKKVIEEANEKLQAMEEKVAKVGSMVETITEAGASVKEADSAVAEAQVELKTMTRFMEAQSRKSGIAKDELAKLQPRIDAAQEAVTSTSVAIKAQADKAHADAILKEAEQKLKEAEEAVVKASEAETPLLKEDMPEEEANNAQAALESAASTAQNMASAVKTFIAMKKLNAKKLSESTATSTTEALAAMQQRFESSTKRLSEIRRGVNERKQARLRKELEVKVCECELKLEVAGSALKGLLDQVDSIKPEDMKEACEVAQKRQKEADTLIQATRKAISERRGKAIGPSESVLAGELGKLMDKLADLQTEIDKQKASLKEHELKFVAQQLVKDAKDSTQKLQTLLEACRESASSLISDSQEDNFKGSLFLGVCTDAMKLHMQNSTLTSAELFSKISGEADKIEEAKFVAFLMALPEVKEQQDLVLSESHLKSAFKKFDQSNGSADEISQATFVDHFRNKFVCASQVLMTDDMVVKGGKTIRKLAVNEVVEALGEPSKDQMGLLRVKARAEKDGKEGFVTVAGNQGTVYLQPFSAYGALKKKIERELQELHDEINKTAKSLDTKIKDLKQRRVGPLTDAREELLKVAPTIGKVKDDYVVLAKLIQKAQRRHDECLEEEKRRQLEAKQQAVAAKMTEAALEKVSKMEQEVDKFLVEAEELVRTAGANHEKPLEAMAACCRGLEKSLAGLPEADDLIKQNVEELKNSAKGRGRGPLDDARNELLKLKAKLSATESRCRKQIGSLQAASRDLNAKALAALTTLLRAHVLEKEILRDDLFAQLSKDGVITLESFREYVEKIPNNSLKASQFDLALGRYSSGISKLILSEILQEYLLCVKEIAVTSACEVKGSKTLRKLELGEVVQVTEVPKGETKMGLLRVKCLALMDSLVGWVSVKGNQGTNFLQKTSKPFLCCDSEVSMQAAFESQSEATHTLKKGEVIEILDGPRREPETHVVRARVKCLKYGKTGWMTKDVGENNHLEVKKMMRCQAGIAITDIFDIATAVPIRKLEVGELMEVLEGVKEDTERKMTRIKVKTQRDNKEGWVTLRGNQGTDYLIEDESHQICKRSLPMEGTLQPGTGDVARLVEQDEVVQVLELKTVTVQGAMRVRGQNLSTGAEGWVSPSKLRPWIPRYRCLISTEMLDGLSAAKPMRQLQPGEFLEALATPVADSEGIMCVRVRTENDGLDGFVRLYDTDSNKLLESVEKQKDA